MRSVTKEGQIIALLDVTTYGLVDLYQRFGGVP